MTGSDRDRDSVNADACSTERKFGAFAQVYAQSRSEAAQLSGDEASRVHWKKVADQLPD